MNDREFLTEVGPWGFAVTVVTMFGIFFARLATDIGPLQSFGYTLAAFVLVPFLWLSSGRYSAYWLLRSKRKGIVRGLFICFWGFFTAKLFFLGESNSISPYGISLAMTCGLFSCYAANCSFRRVEAGAIEEFHEYYPAWLVHVFLVLSLLIFFMV